MELKSFWIGKQLANVVGLSDIDPIIVFVIDTPKATHQAGEIALVARAVSSQRVPVQADS